MSKRSDMDLLDDILICMDKIHKYIDGMTYDEFENDSKTQDAIIRNIEVIGEAVKQLSDVMKAKYPGIPWKEIAGTRDRLIHDYFGVNIDIIWEIATIDIPKLKLDIEEIKNKIINQ